MSKKKKHKVCWPTDRTGEKIQIGDVLQWDDGSRIQVNSLTYVGNNDWMCNIDEDDDEFSDNLGVSLIVWKKGK